MSTDVVYSPLCDVDKSIYLAYLVVKFSHGKCASGADEGHGVGGDGATSGGGVDSGGSFVATYVGACRAAGVRPADLGVRGRGVRGDGTSRTGAGAAAWRREGPGVGVPSSDGSGGECGVVVSGGGATVDAVVDSPGKVLRGSNYRRNSRNRERRKIRAVSPSTPVSFFSTCPDELRADLVRSRAEMYVAENQRRKALAESAVKVEKKVVSDGSGSDSGASTPKVTVPGPAAVVQRPAPPLEYVALTKAERYIVDKRHLTISEVSKGRVYYGRPLVSLDFISDANLKLSRDEKIKLSELY